MTQRVEEGRRRADQQVPCGPSPGSESMSREATCTGRPATIPEQAFAVERDAGFGLLHGPAGPLGGVDPMIAPSNRGCRSICGRTVPVPGPPSVS